MERKEGRNMGEEDRGGEGKREGEKKPGRRERRREGRRKEVQS